MLFRVADHAKLWQIDPKLSFTVVNGTDRVVSEEEKQTADTEFTVDEMSIVFTKSSIHIYKNPPYVLQLMTSKTT